MLKIIRYSLLLGKHSFHTSAILYSKNNPQTTSPSLETTTESSSQNSVENQLRERNERLLQEEQRGESTVEQGTNIDVFDSYNIFTAHEEPRSLSDWDDSPQVQYPNSNSNLNQSENVTESTETLSNSSETLNTTNSVDVPRPLGEAGDITLNQIVTNLQNLNWPEYINRINVIGVKPFDLAAQSVSYSLLLRGYINRVHNRPYATNISPSELLRQRRVRRNQLMIFTFAGAPLIMYSLRYSAIYFRDTVQIEIRPNEPNSNSTDNSENSNNSALLFPILTKFKNQKPNWFIFLAILIIVIILSLKIGGLLKFWFVYSVLGVSMAISYQLVNLFILYLVEKKKTNVPFILPDFIRNRLKKEFEELSQFSKEGLNSLKFDFYLHLFMYLAIVFIALLIFL